MGSIVITVVGGPTALLELDGLVLLTDPTFSPPGTYSSPSGARLVKTAGPAFGIEDLPPIDAVLLSHDQHPDNLDPGGRELLATGVPTVISTAAAAARLGPPVRPLAVGESTDLVVADGRALTVTAVPAQHGPEGAEAVAGEVLGFVISGASLPTVYVSGDNASSAVVAGIADRYGPVDVALLFAGAARSTLFGGAPLTLSATQAAEAARRLDARVVVPLHIQGWAHYTEGPADLATAFARAGLTDRLVLPRPGRRLDLQHPAAAG